MRITDVSELITTALSGLSLEMLANEANLMAEDAVLHMMKGAQSAWKSGQYLLAAKAQVPHGQWRAWLGANFDREARTATRYIEIATAFPTLESLNGVLSVRQALRLIAADKADDTIEIQPIPVSEPEPELAFDDWPEVVEEPEPEPQERPTVRKVSAESRKVPESQKSKTPEVTPVLVDEADEMVLYHRVGESYCLADADDVAVAALQLHEPISLVRMAVLAVAPKDWSLALDELQQACKWLEMVIAEGKSNE